MYATRTLDLPNLKDFGNLSHHRANVHDPQLQR
jgi:hypothetical protein